MKVNRFPFALLLLILVGAAFLRFYDLDYRPMHGDEANQAMKTGILLETGRYVYDPFEHHGPTLYYLTLPILWATGAETVQEISETMLRVLPACFGLGLVWLSWLLVSPIDRRAGLWAALLTAVCHGLTYYSRYYVQEMLFVFFAGALLWCGFHYLRTRRMGWALGAGAFLGLLHATKETSLLVVAAMLAALACALVWERFVSKRAIPLSVSWKPVVAALAVAAAVSVVFFSSFFSHWRGPVDSLLTYGTYLGRAEGHGSSGLHEHPWYYYLSLLAWTYREAGPKWSEAIILALAMGASLRGLARPLSRATAEDPDGTADALLERFIIFYALFLTAGFSLIPYKTPWNLLIFLHPLCLLAGLGAPRLVALPRFRIAQALVAVLLLAGVAQLAAQTWRGVLTYGADARNPYAYAHTSSAIRRLTERVAGIAAVHPRGDAIHINVFRPDGDYWPLPWYLRRYPNVGYWPSLPEKCDADIILTSPEVASAVLQCVDGEYHFENHGLRPGVLMPTFVRQDLWQAFMAAKDQNDLTDRKDEQGATAQK